MTVFRILFGIDTLVAVVALWFFVIGLGDGSVSSFNMLLWLVPRVVQNDGYKPVPLRPQARPNRSQ